MHPLQRGFDVRGLRRLTRLDLIPMRHGSHDNHGRDKKSKFCFDIFASKSTQQHLQLTDLRLAEFNRSTLIGDEQVLFE